MIRKRHYIFLYIFILFFFSNLIYSQSIDNNNSRYSSISVIKRLSYENFKNIKLLKPAIMNYGGGESEVQKLVDQYSEATALYFEEKVEDAAIKFSENEKEIFKTAKKIAGEYNKDLSTFLTKSLKRSIQISLERELEGNNKIQIVEKYLENAKFSQKKANSIFDDYKYTSEKSVSSARRLITSIYYYRQAKQNLFLMYQAYADSLKLDPDTTKDKQLKKQLIDKMIKEDYKEDYRKDLQDNKNKVYTSMEKKV